MSYMGEVRSTLKSLHSKMPFSENDLELIRTMLGMADECAFDWIGDPSEREWFGREACEVADFLLDL